MPSTNLEKKVFFDQLRLKDRVIMVVCDGRDEEASLPTKLQDEPETRLAFNYKNGAGCYTDDDLLVEEMRFDGTWCEIIVPWRSVYAIYDKEVPDTGLMWKSDIPSEVRKDLVARNEDSPQVGQPPPTPEPPANSAAPTPPVPPPMPKRRQVGNFTVIDGGKAG